MHYEGNIIRPPSEADSIILQVTVGCSHNRCTFCGAYKDELFRIKDDRIITEDLDFAAAYCRRQKKIFLADGDVLSLSTARLAKLFRKIRAKIPFINRINLYGSARSVRTKTVEDLRKLKDLGLNRVYMGLESGLNLVLEDIRKGSRVEEIIAAADTINKAGLYLSVTVLLGIGGIANSLAHAAATGMALTAMKPKQIGVLTLMLLPGTNLNDDFEDGTFTLPDQHGLLLELREMLYHVELEHALFQSNHASNYLPLNARLPRDKEILLAAIDQAVCGKTRLTPEHQRRL